MENRDRGLVDTLDHLSARRCRVYHHVVVLMLLSMNRTLELLRVLELIVRVLELLVRVLELLVRVLELLVLVLELGTQLILALNCALSP